MNEAEINSLLRKADELKALFILGQRVIPFLEELFLFVRDIKPMLDDINFSIQENLKKMPSASKQLSKVTEATENATNEIMDIIDGVIYKTDLINGNLKKIDKLNSDKSNSPLKILDIIYETLKNDEDLQDLLPKLTSQIKEIKSEKTGEMKSIVKETHGLVESIQNDSSSIMMSLQVQDITSQQIAAVNHLLETIQTKLNKIMSRLKSSEISDLMKEQDSGYNERTNVSKMHRNIAFDPHAVDSISFKETRQMEVDAAIAEHKQTGIIESGDEASPEDIDALFSGNSIDIDTSIFEEDAESRVDIIESDSDEPVSQDDIDALFGKV
jgi:chemotaxis regulatin CheY-phosphate phosphatase CheZ